jgi:hypothetical protein
MTEGSLIDCCNWAPIDRNERLAEMVRLFQHSVRYVDATEGRSGINGQQHALRCAALGRDRGAHPEMAFIGLVHDLARPLNDVHHGEVIAEMVRDRVTEPAYHILRSHGEFQSAFVHSTPLPYQDQSVWYNEARLLMAFEAYSFSDKYAGPEMAKAEAIVLIRTYLG